MNHPSLAAGNVAVVTGGASGIGLACARKFAALGMAVCIADLVAERIARAAEPPSRVRVTFLVRKIIGNASYRRTFGASFTVHGELQN